MGENGAGKSTLMKILAGLDPARRRRDFLQGPRAPSCAIRTTRCGGHRHDSPGAAALPGIDGGGKHLHGPGAGALVRRAGWTSAAMQRRRRGCWSGSASRCRPRRKMKDLSVAEMQTVEIAKALAHRAEVIIMDEPTSAISEREVEALFGIIRDLKQHGVAVIYISHKMDEVFRIADAVTVLRDGRCVGHARRSASWTADRLIALMVGRELKRRLRGGPGAAGRGGAGGARPDQGRAGSAMSASSVRRGEILGLAGLMGAGRTELVERDLRPGAGRTAGRSAFKGAAVAHRQPRATRSPTASPWSPRTASDTAWSCRDVRRSTTSRSPACAAAAAWIHRPRARKAGRRRAGSGPSRSGRRSRDQPVGQLSGGNQQKVVIAKALLAEPGHPDPGRADARHRHRREGRNLCDHHPDWPAQGKAILLVSSELPEILSLSDRILVMREGRIAAELDPRRTTQEEILKHAMPD